MATEDSGAGPQRETALDPGLPARATVTVRATWLAELVVAMLVDVLVSLPVGLRFNITPWILVLITPYLPYGFRFPLYKWLKFINFYFLPFQYTFDLTIAVSTIYSLGEDQADVVADVSPYWPCRLPAYSRQYVNPKGPLSPSPLTCNPCNLPVPALLAVKAEPSCKAASCKPPL